MWQLYALATYCLSVAGLVFASCDILRMWPSLDKNKPPYDDKLLECITEMLEPKNVNQRARDVILKDYEVCQAEIVRRDNSTLLVGSIFTTASLLILANTISQGFRKSMFIYAFASIMLFLLWLLVVHWSATKLDDITYKRIHTIEEALTLQKSVYPFGLHSYIWQETHPQGKVLTWLRIRRTFWSVILMLISLTWMLLALTILWQFWTILSILAICIVVVFSTVYYEYVNLQKPRAEEALLTTSG